MADDKDNSDLVAPAASNSVVRLCACRVCLHSDHSRIGAPQQTCYANRAVELITLKPDIFFGKKLLSMRQCKAVGTLSTNLR
jgi:hypothetical protein